MKRRTKILGILTGLLVLGILFQSFQSSIIKKQMANYHVSDSVVIEKGRFQNIESTKVMQGMSGSTLKEFMRKGEKVPEQPLPYANFDKSQYNGSSQNQLSVTWFGHSCALIQMDGKLILTDPALSVSAGPTSFTGTKRFHKEVPISIEELPNIDVVLISHDHFDHLDKNSIKALDKKTKKFVVPTGVAKRLLKWNIDPDKIKERSWWEAVNVEGINFVSTPARHFSGRGLFDRNTTLWCSWVIEGKTKKVYFSGDSGYQKAFKEIGEKYGPFDLSLLENGQYNDDWGLIHMNPEESVQAGLDTKTKVALPIHWGGFSLSVHSWYEPIERFVKKAEETNLKYVTPMIGEKLIINDATQTDLWWRKITQK